MTWNKECPQSGWLQPLDGALRAGAAGARWRTQRCVRHRCVAAPPLAVPLPFPQLFAPAVLRHGDPGHALHIGHSQGLGQGSGQGLGQGLGQGPGQGMGGPAEVESVPVLTRMYSSGAAASAFAQRQLLAFRSAPPAPCSGAAGERLCLQCCRLTRGQRRIATMQCKLKGCTAL